MSYDPTLVSAIAQADQGGDLDDVRALLDPDRPNEEENFLGGLTPDLAAILAFCVAVGTISGAAKSIADMIGLANKAAKWAKSLRGEKPVKAELTLRERTLALLFEATTNRREGLSAKTLQTILGCSHADLDEALTALEHSGVARKSLQGNWKFSSR